MKSILDLAYGVLAGRIEAPKRAAKRREAAPVAREAGRPRKHGKPRPAPAGKARGAPMKKGIRRAAASARGRR